MTHNEHRSLAGRLPFWHFEDTPGGETLMVYGDGSLGRGFRLRGADISCADDGRINELNAALGGLLASLPEGTRIQTFYRLSPSGGGLPEAHEEASRGSPGNYAPVRNSRLRCLKEDTKEGGIFTPEVFVFARGRPHRFQKRRLWQPPRRFERITRTEFEEHRKDFLKLQRALLTHLRHAGLGPQGLDKEEWFKLIFGYLNPDRSEKIGTPKLREAEHDVFCEPLNSQAVLTDIHVHKDRLEIGGLSLRSISLKTLPEGETQASMVDGFLKSLPFHFWVSQTTEIGNQKQETDKLQLGRRLANAMAGGSNGVADLESESKLRHTEELLSELLEGSQKVVRSGFNITVWGEDEEELDEKSDSVLRALQSMGGSEGLVETLPLADSFFSDIPGACEVSRGKKMKTDNCAHLMPVYSHWKGNAKPVCLFKNRDGGLVGYDPFAPELPSWNALIFASTGAGKSFTILQTVMQFYGQRPTPRIVWIDNGASSERVLDKSILDGQFIDLSPESNIRINPFDLAEGETVPPPSKIKFVLAVLEQIFKEREGGGLPKRHAARLEELIYQAYGKSEDVPTLGDFKKILDLHESPEMREYGQMLFSWTGNTAYGKLLDGKTNVETDGSLTTVEAKGLDAYPDLQNVMLLNFTEFIKTKAANDTSRPTLLIVDEAWKLLDSPSGRDFVTEAFRTFRKFGAAIWCISQNYKDFLRDGATADSILPNTASIFVLKQSKIDWEDFQKRLQLGEAETEAAKGLVSVKGEYSEALLVQGDDRAILRIEADPLAYWIATTDPADKRAIAETGKANPELSKLETLEILARKGRGGGTDRP